MAENTALRPILSKLSVAEEQLQYVLDHPLDGLDRERIMMALSLIKFERSKNQDEAKQANRSRPERKVDRRSEDRRRP